MFGKQCSDSIGEAGTTEPIERAVSDATMVATPNHRGGLPAAATLYRIRATLRSALNSALREGLIVHNPVRYVELPAPRRQYAQVWTNNRVREWERTGQRFPVAVWTAELLAEFLKSVEQDRLCALRWLIALRGLRRGKAAGLRWVDVDLDERTITISQQRIVCGRRILVGPQKAAASRRVIALDSVTVRVLRAHRQRQLAEMASAGFRWVESGYVFTNRFGKPISPHSLGTRLRTLVDRAGMPPVRLHDLRHGAASLARAVGADLKTVQDQLGHSSIVSPTTCAGQEG